MKVCVESLGKYLVYLFICRRLLGLNPEVIETKEIGSEEDENGVPELDKVKIKHVRKENEMIDRTGMEETIVVDGHYRGFHFNNYFMNRWVDPEVCKRYGIPESKEELGTKNDHSASEIDKTVPKPKSKKGTVIIHMTFHEIVYSKREQSKVFLFKSKFLFLQACGTKYIAL